MWPLKSLSAPNRELCCNHAVAHPPHRLTEEVGGAAGGVGPALVQTGHQHSPVPAAMASSGSYSRAPV